MEKASRMRSTAAILVVILTVTVGVSGCETIRENPKTATGAGVGTAGGAVVGGVVGRSATGVVVGGLLGALAGGAIGYYLDHQDRTREQAASATDYSSSHGDLVRVERVDISPQRARPGGTVNLGATYTVLTPDAGRQVTVRETREVRHDGLLVANPTTQATRANGTFTSTLPITLPPSARPGLYEVTTTVSMGDRTSHGVSSFTVN